MKLYTKSKEEKVFQPLAKEIIFKNRLNTIGETTEETAKDNLNENIRRNKSVSRIDHFQASKFYTRNASYSEKTANRKNSARLQNGKRAMSTKTLERKQNQINFVTQMYSRVSNHLTELRSPSDDSKTQTVNTFYSVSKQDSLISKTKNRSINHIKSSAEESTSKPSDESSLIYSFSSKPTKFAARIPPLISKSRQTDHTESSFQSNSPIKPVREQVSARLVALMPHLKKPIIGRIQSERTYTSEPIKGFKDEVDFLLKYVYECDESTKDMISSYILFDQLKASKDE